MKHNRLYITFLKSFAWKKKLLVLYTIIISFIMLNTSISLIRPKLQGTIIDDLSNPHRVNQVIYNRQLAFFLGIMLVSYMVSYVQKYIVTVVSEEIAADVRQKIHDKLATVKVEFFNKVELSDVLLKIDKDTSAIKQCGITSIITLISNAAILVVVPPYMFSIHKGIALSNILLLISVPFISRLLGKQIQKTSKLVLQGYNDVTNILTNNYNNWFVIRIFHCYQYIHDKYRQKNRMFKDSLNIQNLMYILNVMSSLVVQFLGIIIIWVVGSKEIFAGNMTIGTIMALMNYQTIIMNPIIGIADFANEYHTAIVSLKDIYSLLEYPDTESEKKLRVLKISEIKLNHVDFQYPQADNAVFNNFCISLKKGMVYAIHGKSGDGKSTLFKLLTAIYKPTKGEILINGKALENYDMTSYWKKVGYVMQRSQFFKDTIQINMFCETSNEKLNEMAKSLDLFEDIHSLPAEWETEIKTDPYNFSEGQMRRMDILRNMIKKTEVLIFDEATANIDSKRRKKFYSLLHQLAADKIIIFSTHNTEEQQEADVVIDLSQF